jgi:superfamily II DNA or RNA helicase
MIKKIDKIFANYEIDDQRSAPLMENPIAFTGTLKDYQEKATADFLSYESGQMRSGCRSGKTVMFVYMICKF